MRSTRIDALRFIGLALVILAHMRPPYVVFQLRNFDVPLMVLVSGLSFGVSASDTSYLRYVWRRIQRLVFPCWLFLTAYFLGNWLMLVVTDHSLSPVTGTAMRAAFLLTDNGYFWIIRIFLLVALLAPLVSRVSRALPGNVRYLAFVVLSYGTYEVARVTLMPQLGGVLGSVALYAVPYAAVFAIGLRLDSMPRSVVAGLSAAAFAAFSAVGLLLLMRTGHPVSTQSLKYPPSAYYIAYGLSVACLLSLIPERFWQPLASGNIAARGVLFIARNSLWTYLWHIVFAEVVQTGFILRYLLVFALAGSTAAAQVWFVRKKVVPRLESRSTRGIVLRLFTG